MLPRESLCQHFLIKTRRNKIIIRRTLTRQNLATRINERQNNRFLKTLVLGLHVIENALVFDVRVVAGDHFDEFVSKDYQIKR